MKRRTTGECNARFGILAEQFAALTRALYDGVLIYDAGVILKATAGAEVLFGRTARGLDQCPVAELFADESKPALHQHLRSQTASACPMMAVRADGTRVPVEVSIQARLTLKGRQIKVLALRDASRDKATPHRTDRAVEGRRAPVAARVQPN